jgi:hypothetical protein
MPSQLVKTCQIIPGIRHKSPGINKASERAQPNFFYQGDNPKPSGFASGREEAFTVSSPIVKQKWAIKDITPFNEENYISSPNNYMDKITFQLYKTYDGETIS